MSRPLPKNLTKLRALIGTEEADKMLTGHSFSIDGVEFVTGYRPDSTADRFYIVKSEAMLDIYSEFFEGFAPSRIFELGIAEGGSTAMLALRSGVERLVAIDNEQNRLPALDEFVERRGLAEVVKAYFGVDQGDDEALSGILERDFADGAPDLVIDDASHEYGLTKASFDSIFPAVRTGGWYLVEDWAQRFQFFEAVLRAMDESPDSDSSQAETPAVETPLERLGFEFMVAAATSPGVIDRVIANELFVGVRRGPESVDRRGFALDDLTRAEPQVGLLLRGENPET
jgi:hypothetical protein